MIKKENLEGFESHEYCPMIRNKTEELLIKILKETQPKKILEIGTFLGYSASVILENAKDSFVTTIEKDVENAKNATQNLKNLGFDGRFEVKNDDALHFLENLDKNVEFDFIFLDGAKGQYIKYLPYLKSCLKVGGILLADDVLFYGLVNSTEKIAHKHRSIVNNLRNFLSALKDDKDFQTEVFDFDDGVSLSRKLR